MASKQVISKSLPLLNSSLNNHSPIPGISSFPKTVKSFLFLNSTKATQATVICPTGVLPRPPAMDPCRTPKRHCPPSPCDCPPPTTTTMSKRIFRILWFLTRLGLFAGVVKFTVDEGLWSDSEETEELAKRMGIIGENENEEKKQETKLASRGMWNTGVLRASEFFGLEP